jgi:hypothetical protein
MVLRDNQYICVEYSPNKGSKGLSNRRSHNRQLTQPRRNLLLSPLIHRRRLNCCRDLREVRRGPRNLHRGRPDLHCG